MVGRGSARCVAKGEMDATRTRAQVRSVNAGELEWVIDDEKRKMWKSARPQMFYLWLLESFGDDQTI